MPRTKIDKDALRECRQSGMTYKEIAKKFGCSYTAARNAVVGKELVRKEIEPGINGDRHLCRTCRYKAHGAPAGNGARCDYIGITGHMRGCKANECTVYAPRRRIK